MGLQHHQQQSAEKKLLKVKDIQNLTPNNPLLPYAAVPLSGPSVEQSCMSPEDATAAAAAHHLLPAKLTAHALHPTTVVF